MRWLLVPLLILTAPLPAAAFPMRVEDCPAPLLRGTDGSDRIVATDPSGARVMGFAGREDVLTGGEGRDCIFGGAGANRIRGGGGDDFLTGAILARGGKPSNSRDEIAGGSGDDELVGWGGSDELSGGVGDDHIDGWGGNDVIEGGPGNDAIGAGGGRNVIHGDAGDDRISAANGETDHVDCGAGSDFVRADRRDDLVRCERVHIEASRWPRVVPPVGSRGTSFRVVFTPPLDGYVSVEGQGEPRGCRPVRFFTTFGHQRSATQIPLAVGRRCRGTYRLRVLWEPGFPSGGGGSRLPWCDLVSQLPPDADGDSFYCYGFFVVLGKASFTVR